MIGHLWILLSTGRPLNDIFYSRKLYLSDFDTVINTIALLLTLVTSHMLSNIVFSIFDIIVLANFTLNSKLIVTNDLIVNSANFTLDSNFYLKANFFTFEGNFTLNDTLT